MSEAVIDNSDYLQFTGSSATGVKVMERAARRLTPVSLELGGKDPMLVLEDADIELAANAAVWGAMFNAGQTCVSVERVYVLEPAYDQFVAAVVKAVENLKVGAGEGYDFGALIDESQVAVTARHVDDALAKGAKALTGGKRTEGAGSFYPPTVLVDVDHSMACMTEETFGPTLPIMKVSSVGEAVRLANDSPPYGLSAVVFSKDVDRAKDVALQLDCGAVNINDVISNLMCTTAPPMGGWKTSGGIGARFGGVDGGAQVLPAGDGGGAAAERGCRRQLLQQFAQGAGPDEQDDDQAGAGASEARGQVAHLLFTWATPAGTSGSITSSGDCGPVLLRRP